MWSLCGSKKEADNMFYSERYVMWGWNVDTEIWSITNVGTAWRKMINVRWQEHITNNAILRRVKEDRKMPNFISSRMEKWLGHCLRRRCLCRKMSRNGKQGIQMDEIMKLQCYVRTKGLVHDRIKWKVLPAGRTLWICIVKDWTYHNVQMDFN